MTSPQPELPDDSTIRLTPAELSSPTDPPPASPQPAPTPAQHPTGDPELTAGWYRPEVEADAKTQAKRDIELDESGMPRLRRVTEQDPSATRVQRRATQLPPTVVSQRPSYPPPPADPTLVHRAAPRRRFRLAKSWRGCLWRAFVYGTLGIIGLIIVGFGAVVVGYLYVVRDLPTVGDLEARASQFETTRIYDSQGNLLYELVDPQAGRRTTVPLDQISPYLIAATIATEDKNFYSHPGFDPLGILRAIVQNVQEGDTVSGASTITQQLVRALVLSSEERAQRTAMRKIREILLAAEVTRTYPRDKILEIYLNEIYYGNLAYGIEAASETYFNKKAKDLTLGEAAFLAGLPQSPAIYDIYTNPEATRERQRQVLTLMLALTIESPEDCIPVSTGKDTQKICATAESIGDALTQFSDSNLYPFNPPKIDARFPHWVNYIRQILEAQYGSEIYRDGYSVFTTLDPNLQTQAELAVAEQVTGLADRHVTNGALVSLRPTTGEILVMVGSDNYDDPTDGQINMALRPRQPGSSIKSLTYALAFEKGWTPATLLWDVPTEFPDGANPPYKPVNYDGRFHGGATVRSALANSYNIPAVKALQFVGIRGLVQTDGSGNTVADTGFIPFAEKLGITTLTRDDYGLSLTLGGGEVPLMEMVTAYGALANNGQRVFPVVISKITTFSGDKVICQQPLNPADLKTDPPPCQAPPADWGAQVLSAETAYLISNILSDNAARSPAFGPNSQLRLSFDAAVKTGTTNDFIDNWTIGYTPDLVTGVWVGNADYTPMINTSGLTGAAPIWHTFMEAALAGRASPFGRPASIVERQICAISGAEPGEFCPPDQIRTEVFAPDKLPLPKTRDLWQRAFIDSFTGLYQTAVCADIKYYQNDRLLEQEKIVIGVSDPFAQKWLTEDPNGQAWAASVGITPPIVWAPTGDCKEDSPHPIMEFSYPAEGTMIVDDGNPIQIFGQAAAQPLEQFDHYIIEYGLSHDPQGWGLLFGPSTNPVLEGGKLADWDLTNIPDGPITLRLIVYSKTGGAAEERVKLTIQKPTPTAAPSETVIPSVTPTPTVTPTLGGRSTLTPTITQTPTPTLPPSETPVSTATPTETPVLSDTPTQTIEPTVTETATTAPP